MKLADSISKRDIERAAELVTDLDHRLRHLTTTSEEAYHLLYCFARWCDLDPSRVSDVEKALAAFLKVPQTSITQGNALYLSTTEGILAFQRDRYQKATSHMRFAMALADQLKERTMQVATRYLLGRSLWKSAHYDEALAATREAKILCKHGPDPCLGVITMVEAWLLFKTGDRAAAEAALNDAAGWIAKGDHVERGNVASFRGRLARQAGDLDEALQHFENAIGEFKGHNKEHRNIGRAHVQIAFLKRLKALDADAKAPSGADRKSQSDDVAALRAKAECHLNEATAIYEKCEVGQRRGLGTVYINRALLRYDGSLYAEALAYSQDAIGIGQRRVTTHRVTVDEDNVVLANAYNLQSMIRLELDIESGHDAFHFARLAHEHATRTDSARLKARTLIQKARTLLVHPLNDPIEAMRCYETASDLLGISGQRDYLSRDLGSLKSDIDEFGSSATHVVHTVTAGAFLEGTLEDALRKVERAIVRFIYKTQGENKAKTAAMLGINTARVTRNVTAQVGRDVDRGGALNPSRRLAA